MSVTVNINVKFGEMSREWPFEKWMEILLVEQSRPYGEIEQYCKLVVGCEKFVLTAFTEGTIFSP